MRYEIVDVFSERPFAGNALCVVVDECPPELQQAVAREVNLSETTFPTVTGERSYRNRIYTTTTELPFAGHPTLGTAWVLGPGRWEQTTAGAVVTIEVDGRGAVMTQPDPTFTDVDPDGIAAALGISGVEALVVAEAAGNRFLLAPTEADPTAARPDPHALTALAARHDAFTVAAIRRVDDDHLHVRVFVPHDTFFEDPGTGSAAGPIATLARDRWGTATDVVIHQGDEIGRPCRIEVHAEPGALRVGGAVTRCATGSFVTPDL